MILRKLICVFVLILFTQLSVTSDKMNNKVISTTDAPKAVGPYSQAIQARNTLYLAGQIAIDPKTGKMNHGSIQQQTKQVLENIQAVLKAAGFTLCNVVQSQVLLLT